MTSEQTRASINRNVGVSLMVLGMALAGWAIGKMITPGTVPRFPVIKVLVTLAGGTGVGLGIFFLVKRNTCDVKSLLLMVGTLGAGLLVAELILAWAGYVPSKRLVLSVPAVATYGRCDEDEGFRYDRARLDVKDRPFFNSAGYRDTDEFTGQSISGNPWKVLLLGDSFAYGAAAVYGNADAGFADILESDLGHIHRTVVWNTGIPGVGQKQERVALMRYFPAMQPDAVVLAFCMNDYDDNYLPLGIYYVFSDGKWINRWEVRPEGEPRKLTPREAYLRAVSPPRSIAECIQLTRLGTALFDADRNLCRRLGRGTAADCAAVADTTADARAPEDRVVITRALLGEIKAYLDAAGRELLVLIIPDASDLKSAGANYQLTVRMCMDLGIDYVEVRTLLNVSDYASDGHWKASGHKKVGRLLAQKLAATLPAAAGRN